jgi:hypothetical protein
MTAPGGVNDFDELVNQQVRNKGPLNSDIGLMSGDLMEFEGGNGDISGFTFGDDEYGNDMVNVPHGISGKESTGKFNIYFSFILGVEQHFERAPMLTVSFHSILPMITILLHHFHQDVGRAKSTWPSLRDWSCTVRAGRRSQASSKAVLWFRFAPTRRSTS